MAGKGMDVIEIGSSRVGQRYVLGARVPLDNPNWRGPWDCAEFTSWCAYQAYELVFGANQPRKIAKAEPYSGYWYGEAKKFARVISWQAALDIPGAFLIRAPSAKIGHVAISMGDGKRTLEARGKAFGVGIFDKAKTRPWSIGALLPGVDYDGTVPPPPPVSGDEDEEAQGDLPPGFLWLKRPNLKGPDVLALQRALLGQDVDPGPLDGEFGPMTSDALISFQAREGLEVDGVLGPFSAAALGLAFPVKPTAADKAAWEALIRPDKPPPITLPPVATGSVDTIVNIAIVGGSYRATTKSGAKFLVGSVVNFTDDMHRRGLMQRKAEIEDSQQFGVYKAADFTAAFEKWAHFIEPTLAAEGNARFATLNTYDRAAFTFGAPQLAAHTPGANFILYLRALLALPDAAQHFPELSLRGTGAKKTVHLAIAGGGFRNLEEVVEVTRPNGRREKQLKLLMDYLNPSATAVDDAEVSAGARLMNWLKQDRRAKEAQIAIFIDQAKTNLARAKTKLSGFDGTGDWRIALWIMDILHQGRGTFPEMAVALAGSSPVDSLMSIGLPKYKARIETVAAAVARLKSSGVLTGFAV